MAFTDVEMAILSQLAYYGSDSGQSQPTKGQSLYSVLTNPSIKSYLENRLGASYNDALQKLTDKVANKDYSIALSVDDNKGSGFAAIAIKDPFNEVTVAARGTEGFDVFNSDASRRDVASDVALAFSVSTQQQEAMEKFMRDLAKDNYDGYYFTGHSLGGNLANYGAITFKPLDKVKGVVTFNAPGFNEAFISKYAGEIAAIHNKINNYQNEYDYVSSIMFVPGIITIVPSSKKEDGLFDFDDHLGFDDHGLNNFTIENNEFAKKNPPIKSLQTDMAHHLVEELRWITGIKKHTLLVSVFEICIVCGRFAIKALKGLFDKIKDIFVSNKGSSISPYFQVDTGALRQYASRLQKVNSRLVGLDRRLDALYWQVGFKDIFNLLRADALTGYSWKLTRCVSYLNDTASDFENIERTVSSKL